MQEFTDPGLSDKKICRAAKMLGNLWFSLTKCLFRAMNAV